MSLLMDALKKAEQAKRQGRAATPDAGVEASAGELRLEPVEASAADRTATPASALARSDSTTSLDATTLELTTSGGNERPVKLPPSMSIPDSDFLGMAPPAVTTTRRLPESGAHMAQSGATVAGARLAVGMDAGANPATAERAAAANVFTAKQPATGTQSRSFALIVGSISVLAAVCIGGYFWWQLQPKGQAAPVIARPAAMPVASAPSAATAATTPSANLAAGPTASAGTPGSAAGTATTNPATNPAFNPAFNPAGSTVPASALPAAESKPAVRRARASDTSGESDSPVRLSRAPLKIDPQLQMAYDALGRGEFVAARRGYEIVLANDPNNSDALLGLGALALREERPEWAERAFRQALVINPKEGRAMSGLLEIYGKTQPAAAEPRLRALIADYPDLPAPQVALGNLYARSQRWHEAQQAYFAAYSQQPENADVLFNLAISLEHLNQPRLARQYYGEALKAARHGSVQFDPAVASERLRTLSEQ